jgi:thiol:disulfide interchange protein DsbD
MFKMKKVLILIFLLAEISNGLFFKNEIQNNPLFKFKDLPFEKLIQISKDVNRPLVLFFTGNNCDNVKLMNQMILENEIIKAKLEEDFIFAPLYVDSKVILPKLIVEESRKIRTVGDRNIHLQKSKFKSNVQPTFIVLNPDGTELMRWGYILEDDFNKNLDAVFLNIDQ